MSGLLRSNASLNEQLQALRPEDDELDRPSWWTTRGGSSKATLVSPPLEDVRLPVHDPDVPLQASAYKPVPFTSVRITPSSFWADKQRLIATATLPAIWSQLVETKRLEYLKGTWKEGMPFKPQKFDESDVTKFIEAACYALLHEPPNAKVLRSCVETAIDMLLSGQQDDGYINAFVLSVHGRAHQFANLRDDHELYNLGHLLEASLAYVLLPDASPRLFEGVKRYLALVERTLGVDAEGPGQGAYPGHQEIEIALLRLAESGLCDRQESSRWVKLAQGFLEERGKSGIAIVRRRTSEGCSLLEDGWVKVAMPAADGNEATRPLRRQEGEHYFDWELRRLGGNARKEPSWWGMPWSEAYWYMQAHLPIREQETVRGHAVRVVYWLTAITDLARLTHDASLLRSVHTLWSDMANKTYVTGGIGADPSTEGFSETPYHLPNAPGSIYAETCAAIGVVLLAHRLLQLDLDSTLADRIEWTLFNAVMCGISADGTAFFYDNPLEVVGNRDVKRAKWFTCSCCPPNVSRLISSLGGFICSVSTTPHVDVAVHQFVACKVALDAHGIESGKVVIETRYPLDGDVRIRFEGCEKQPVGLRLRLPAWAHGDDWNITFNGAHVCQRTIRGGYLVFKPCCRRPADLLCLSIDLLAKAIHPHPLVSANANKLAFHRGPLLLALESADHPDVDLRSLRARVPADGLRGGSSETDDDGILKVSLPGSRVVVKDGQQRAEECDLHFVPYHAWANRGVGDLMVWVPREEPAGAKEESF